MPYCLTILFFSVINYALNQVNMYPDEWDGPGPEVGAVKPLPTPDEVWALVPDSYKNWDTWSEQDYIDVINTIHVAVERINGATERRWIVDLVLNCFTWAAPLPATSFGEQRRTNFKIVPVKEVADKWRKISKKLRNKEVWTARELRKSGLADAEGFMELVRAELDPDTVNFKVVPVERKKIENYIANNPSLLGEIKEMIGFGINKALDTLFGDQSDRWKHWAWCVEPEERRKKEWSLGELDNSDLTTNEPIPLEERIVYGFMPVFDEDDDIVRIVPIGYNIVDVLIDKTDVRPGINEHLHRRKLPLGITGAIGAVGTLGSAVALVAGTMWYFSPETDGPMSTPEDVPVEPAGDADADDAPTDEDSTDILAATDTATDDEDDTVAVDPAAHEGEDTASDGVGEAEAATTGADDDADVTTDEDDADADDSTDSPEDELSPTTGAAEAAKWYTMPEGISPNNRPVMKAYLYAQGACAAFIVTCTDKEFTSASHVEIKPTCEEPDIEKEDFWVVAEGTRRYADLTPDNYDVVIPHPKYVCIATEQDGQIFVFLTKDQFEAAKAD